MFVWPGVRRAKFERNKNAPSNWHPPFGGGLFFGAYSCPLPQLGNTYPDPPSGIFLPAASVRAMRRYAASIAFLVSHEQDRRSGRGTRAQSSSVITSGTRLTSRPIFRQHGLARAYARRRKEEAARERPPRGTAFDALRPGRRCRRAKENTSDWIGLTASDFGRAYARGGGLWKASHCRRNGAV